MRHRTESMYGHAIDANGKEHIVTVVGEFEQIKERATVTQDVNIDCEEFGSKKGKLTYSHKVKIRQISFGYAICHSDDEFDIDKGIKIAKKRAINNPVGVLSSPHITMLTKDMCKMLVFGELSHIINNIDNYIKQ